MSIATVAIAPYNSTIAFQAPDSLTPPNDSIRLGVIAITPIVATIAKIVRIALTILRSWEVKENLGSIA